MSKPRVALDPMVLFLARCRKPRRASSAPGGYGTVGKEGCRIIGVDRHLRKEHRIVWEVHHGVIPTGYHVHHKNGNKLDNAISKLELIDPLTHKRIHAGWKIVEGEWIKPCKKCGGEFPLDAFYAVRGNSVCPWCKQCGKRASLDWYRRRKTGQIG